MDVPNDIALRLGAESRAHVVTGEDPTPNTTTIKTHSDFSDGNPGGSRPASSKRCNEPSLSSSNSAANAHAHHLCPDNHTAHPQDASNNNTSDANENSLTSRSAILTATAQLLAAVDTRGMRKSRKRLLKELREQLGTLGAVEREEARPKRHDAGISKDIPVIHCAGSDTQDACLHPVLLPLGHWGNSPRYCVRHIWRDPDALVARCPGVSKNPSHDGIGSDDNCTEVVIKGMPVCHKHMPTYLTTHATYQPSEDPLTSSAALTATKQLSLKCHDIVERLRSETTTAQPMAKDVHQMLGNLLPKYQSIICSLSEHEGVILSRIAHTPQYYS